LQSESKVEMGGLSGKPLTSRSTEVIRFHLKSKKAFPIIGVGGIHSADDAIETRSRCLSIAVILVL
jgi:dihydroorotate dehydrogenase